jgi:hypothetical protein
MVSSDRDDDSVCNDPVMVQISAWSRVTVTQLDIFVALLFALVLEGLAVWAGA